MGETDGAAPQAELRITLTADGQVQVSGPIGQLVLCYGLLEAARDAIQKHAAQKPKGGIVAARGAFNGLKV